MTYAGSNDIGRAPSKVLNRGQDIEPPSRRVEGVPQEITDFAGDRVQVFVLHRLH